MDYILLIATLTLLSQIGIFVLLYASLQLKKIGRYREKGILMTTGVILHMIIIFVIMLPSFWIGLVPQIVKPPLDVNTFLVPAHVVTGTIAAALGVWIVGSWRLRKSLEFCAPKKRWMRVTLYIWLASIILGFILYLNLFKTIFFG
jgi:hypothetical protein